VTIAQQGTTDQWVISLSANTIARPRSVVALALDRSGSMSQDAGDGTTKTAKLKEAVDVFVDTMIEGDALSIVSYDDVVDRLMDATDVGPQPPAAGSGRALAASILAGTGLDPRGNTGIGSALLEAQAALDDAQAVASPAFDVRAIVVLTDGVENVAPMINTVAGSITVPTYAVGLGNPANISVDALDALAQGSGRYLLITGALDASQQFRLSKYFLQILAGITSAEIVLDPSGTQLLQALDLGGLLGRIGRPQVEVGTVRLVELDGRPGTVARDEDGRVALGPPVAEGRRPESGRAVDVGDVHDDGAQSHHRDSIAQPPYD
jgi:hypothetical protein